jgi:hypothetical protein
MLVTIAWRARAGATAGIWAAAWADAWAAAPVAAITASTERTCNFLIFRTSKESIQHTARPAGREDGRIPEEK